MGGCRCRGTGANGGAGDLKEVGAEGEEEGQMRLSKQGRMLRRECVNIWCSCLTLLTSSRSVISVTVRGAGLTPQVEPEGL